MTARYLPLIAAVMLAGGCEFGQIPDKSEPATPSKYDGELLQQNVKRANDVLNDRLARGQITVGEKRELFHDYIRELVADVEPASIPADEVWRFADVYRQMEDWQATRDLYTTAVKNAKTEDRRVNDTLRLAEATAQLGDIEAGMDIVRTTFDAAPGDKAPILMATLYEFVPAVRRRGHDTALAHLLEEAIQQHQMTVVDTDSESGRLFIQARRHHVREAWFAIIRLYRAERDQEGMSDAIRRSETMLRRFATA